ncbi:hypothetical protein P7K49_025422 [Saguinus oedipus]|uniref:Uncharacterized protein n=1 Tax=Saguinus oedipus TaxID=9490 RepID=A0ABQ9UH36_SAGOE|nr:hypothetical protein P7K49_025422 [Saguinus oedipus]
MSLLSLSIKSLKLLGISLCPRDPRLSFPAGKQAPRSGCSPSFPLLTSSLLRTGSVGPALADILEANYPLGWLLHTASVESLWDIAQTALRPKADYLSETSYQLQQPFSLNSYSYFLRFQVFVYPHEQVASQTTARNTAMVYLMFRWEPVSQVLIERDNDKEASLRSLLQDLQPKQETPIDVTAGVMRESSWILAEVVKNAR